MSRRLLASHFGPHCGLPQTLGRHSGAGIWASIQIRDQSNEQSNDQRSNRSLILTIKALRVCALAIGILFATWVLGLGPIAAASRAGQCEVLFAPARANSPQNLAELWRVVPGSYFMALRSNPRHYWGLARQDAQKFLSAENLREGAVTGDPHILNFGDSRVAGERRLMLVDLDDGGRAPLSLDFGRLALMSSLGSSRVARADLIEAYVDGLRGDKWQKPDVLRGALEIGRGEDRRRNERYLDRIAPEAENGRRQLDRSGDRFVPPELVSREVSELLTELRPRLEAELPPGRTLDTAIRIKDSGGSMGQPRFWFLRERRAGGRWTGEFQVFEFKSMGEPATSAWGPQASVEARMRQMIRHYRHELSDENYKLVRIGGRAFWMRERVRDGLDFKDEVGLTRDEIEEKRDMQLYIANWLGRQHRDVAPSWAERMDRRADRDRFKREIEAWIQHVTRVTREIWQEQSHRPAQTSR
jgi:hypothetical protein